MSFYLFMSDFGGSEDTSESKSLMLESAIFRRFFSQKYRKQAAVSSRTTEVH